jgi:hypothetical protein
MEQARNIGLQNVIFCLKFIAEELEREAQGTGEPKPVKDSG